MYNVLNKKRIAESTVVLKKGRGQQGNSFYKRIPTNKHKRNNRIS